MSDTGNLTVAGLSRTTAYPNFRQAWMLVCAFMLIYLAFRLLAGILYAIVPSLQVYEDWVGVSLYMAVFVGTMFYACRASRRTDFSYGVSVGKAPWWLPVVLIPVVPSLTILTDSVASLLPMPAFIEEMLKNMVRVNLPSFLLAVVFAPVCEELLCRGIILKGLLHAMPPYRAIVWSSLIFAVLHLNPWQGVGAFIIGFFMGWLYWKTRAVWICILTHFINNLFAFIVLARFGADDDINDIAGQYYFPLLAVCAAVVAAGALFLYRNLKTINDDNKLYNNV